MALSRIIDERMGGRWRSFGSAISFGALPPAIGRFRPFGETGEGLPWREVGNTLIKKYFAKSEKIGGSNPFSCVAAGKKRRVLAGITAGTCHSHQALWAIFSNLSRNSGKRTCQPVVPPRNPAKRPCLKNRELL